MGALLSAVRPVRRFYLGLLANPYDALSTVAWTEITKVFTSTVRWGAQHELARVEPSYASLLLDNKGGDFETLNAAGPYYPNLRPLNRLRIVDTWAGVDYIRFTGYVVDWPRSWTGINQAVVQLEAYDALGAVLNAVDIPAEPWEMETRNIIESLPSTGKAVWLRFSETSGTVAADSSGYGIDGQYQGTPTLDQPGLTSADDDKAVRFVSGSRASLPFKDLISGYPWSFHCLFRSGTAAVVAKMFLSAYDGPSAGWRQYVQIFISGSGAESGKIIVVVASPSPTGTQKVSTVTVNDGAPHRLAVVCATSTDFKIYLDNVDVTGAWAAAAHSFPNDLVTGYAVGNNPASSYGEWHFGDTADDILDEVLILDGYALTTSDISALNTASSSNILLAPNSGQRLGAVLNAIGWAGADRDIDLGKSAVQEGYVAGKVLSYANRLDLTEGGRLFVNGAGQIVFHDRHRVLKPPYTVSQCTFGEGVGEIGYVGPFDHGEDDQDIWNDIRTGNVGGVVQVARSPTSKARYGWKTLSRTDLLGTSDAEARDRSNGDLARYSEPTTRVRQLVVKPQEDAAQGTTVWPALLGLGQDSRVTVKASPPGASMFTQVSLIERMDETVTATDWQMTLGLSAARAEGAWILDTSALDTGTVLSY